MEDKIVHINCIGVDEKIHVCEPHSDICKCGVKVRTKKLSLYENVSRFSCYECTY